MRVLDTFSAEQIRFLRDSITLVEGNIIVWHEAPEASVAGLEVHKVKIAELVAPLSHFYMLIDVSQSARPKPEFINALKHYMQNEAMSGLQHAAIFVGENYITRFAVQYMGKRMGFLSYSVHMKEQEAFGELRTRQAEQARAFL